MAGIPAWCYAQLGQNVGIEAYSGVTDNAEQFAATVSARAIVEESTQTDRQATPGDDLMTMATLRVPLATNCPAGSRVTLASGRVGIVTDVKRWDGGSTAAPSHLEITISGSFEP